MQNGRMIAIGGSAGALAAVQEILRGLPEEIPAAILVVLHRFPFGEGPDHLAEILQRCTRLAVRVARRGDAATVNTVTVAPADRHLLVGAQGLLVGRGPRENRLRPAIDPLFRSAAVLYRSRVIAILLSGTRDDGVTGLFAVQRCGGVTIIQEPGDAQYPELPEAGLAAMRPNSCVPVAEMAALVNRLVHEEPPLAPEVPRDLQWEAAMAEGVLGGMEAAEEWGRKVPLTCPDCGGQLWRNRGERTDRYRCHQGHAFTSASLQNAQTDRIERTLWVSLRMMEEQARMLRRLVGEQRKLARNALVFSYQDRLVEVEEHAAVLRMMLQKAC